MDLLKRTIALTNINNEKALKPKTKRHEKEEIQKTKSQLDFENGIDNKPLITDMA